MQNTISFPATTRGFADHGWLKSAHTFSFASYFNRDRMGFGALRVINDDEVAPGMGFGTHPHDNMEIITIPLEGALEHKDSMGNGSVIRSGEIQVMSAGSGITHSEFNASKTDWVKLFQIWVHTKTPDVTPQYGQKSFDFSPQNSWIPIVRNLDNLGETQALGVHQDVQFCLATLSGNQPLTYTKLYPQNSVYSMVISGTVIVNDTELKSRDGVGHVGVDGISYRSAEPARVLVMEVPQ